MGATDIVTLAEVKAHLNMGSSDTSQDGELGGFIESVTEVVEHIIGPVVPRAVTEVHDGGRSAIVLRKPPVISVTSVTESGVALTSDGYTLSQLAGVLYRSSGRWVGTTTVVYQAGRATSPASSKQAAKELIALHFRGQQGGNYSPFDTAPGDTAPGGQEILGFFVPNKVMQLLAPHAIPAGFA